MPPLTPLNATLYTMIECNCCITLCHSSGSTVVWEKFTVEYFHMKSVRVNFFCLLEQAMKIVAWLTNLVYTLSRVAMHFP